MAALLHDVVEDCDVTVSEIEELFDSSVADTVDAVTALSDKDFDFANHALTKAQMDLLSDAKLQSKMNSKALLVKIADRIDNLNTLSGVKEEKRIPKAEHTKAIIIPMARLAKADHLADVLKELCFKNRATSAKCTRTSRENTAIFLRPKNSACQESPAPPEQVIGAPAYNSKALSRYRRYIVDLIHSERSYISIYRQISRDASNLKEDWCTFDIVKKQH